MHFNQLKCVNAYEEHFLHEFVELYNGPSPFPTDFGQCCFLVPHLDLEPSNNNLTQEEKYHGLKADVQQGKINDLEFVLDAEVFNYERRIIRNFEGVGFRIVLHHHLDFPLVSLKKDLQSTLLVFSSNIQVSKNWSNKIGMKK